MTNNYTYERRNAWGTVSIERDIKALALDIAAAMGLPASAVSAYDPNEPDMPHEPKHITLPDDSYLIVRSDEWRKADKGKVTITISHPARRNVHYSECPPMPECKVTIARGPDAIAKAVQSRIIEPAAPIIASLLEKQAMRAARRDDLQRQCDALQAATGWTVCKAEQDAFRAEWIGPNSMRGTIDTSGNVRFTNIPDIPLIGLAVFLEGLSNANHIV